MSYPFNHHHHSHRRDADDDEFSGDFSRPPPPNVPSYGGAYPHAPPEPYPPPPTFGGGPPYHHPPPPENYPHPPEPYPPPPAQVTGVYHSSHSHTPHLESQNYPPPPPIVQHEQGGSYVHHSSHVPNEEGHHHFRPHMPAFVEGHFHNPNPNPNPNYPDSHFNEGGGNDLGYLANKPTYRFYCKAGGDEFSVAIRDGKVVLTRSNPSDQTQHWIKDERYSTKVKDAEGYPCFALVNRATGQAVKHSINGHPVQLIPYNPDVFDESVLWTEGKDLGNRFRTIRMVNNIRLTMDAWHGDKDHGGVRDGTIVALFESWKGDNQNQQWKFVPY